MKLAAKRFVTSQSLPRRPDHCIRSNNSRSERVEPNEGGTRRDAELRSAFAGLQNEAL